MSPNCAIERQDSLLFAGLAYHEDKYLDWWKRLAPDSTDPEVQGTFASPNPSCGSAPYC